ncbi:formimidoylglutamate deiminase [Brucella sp. BE17]|uniref:formimidoylglutamate deiminase n=1 Tax=Brucella sp. BE17 TaxID=3142977 RepID=UPI0031BBC020
MTSIFAKVALLKTGCEKDVRIVMDEGTIKSLQIGASPQVQDERHELIIPGTGNLHSHAFQRAMAGLAEVRGPASDSFWSWRTIMYKFALTFQPEQLEAVAAQLYMEMLEAGYTRVGEFHYLHHDRDGQHYANIAEHAERIAAAASCTGISLTLLPVFYAQSGFGGGVPSDGQRRFINSVENYARLIEACGKITQKLAGSRLGIAPHSLRAATPDQLKQILPLAKDGPVHMHISEQIKEVEDCIAWSGARPVEWLLENMPVNENWTLIHATHMTEAETAGMAARRAIAGLCPITEANLGDGIFPAPQFLKNDGLYGIGSDSNVSISLAHELRQLEYSQRLATRSRNVIALPGKSTGERLLDIAVRGSAQALHAGGHLCAGREADFVALDVSKVPYLPHANLLDEWIFADNIHVDSVWVQGKKKVQNGRHIDRDEISRKFVGAMKELLQH